MERNIIFTRSKKAIKEMVLLSLSVFIFGSVFILGVVILVDVSSDLFASSYWQ
ncbi:MAG: hypothetical protein SFY66_20425 [Oculatellaceae cyanobacterium bins.114]|nr:hypothetical protein [Oculatellaceae cyanobacterium bins.114]